MDNEKLKKMLRAAEKYGADAVCEMAAEQDGEDNSSSNADEGSKIAAFINKGTHRIIEGKDSAGNSDRSLTVDPFTNLPM